MEKLGLAPWLVESCRRLQMHTPTEVQQKTIPLILGGNDVVGCSPTGSGKTGCYCLPILNDLVKDPFGVFGLVLLPTRELAVQVAEQFTALGSAAGCSVHVVIGGVDKVKQALALSRRPNVVIGTPGRVSDHVEHPTDESIRKAFRRVNYLVLDEADRLLTSNFEESLLSIIKCLPRVADGRRTLLFSATLTDSIREGRKMISQQLRKVQARGDVRSSDDVSGDDMLEDFLAMKLVDLNPQELPPPPSVLQHRMIFIPSDVKIAYLAQILVELFGVEVPPATRTDSGARKSQQKSQGIIFCATCRMCEVVAVTLQLLGVAATSVHSLQNQKRRFAALAKIRSLKSRILVATDVASRGLDLPKVAFVIHYDFPRCYEDYLHRVGRTARATRKGSALAFVTQKDIQFVHEVEQRMGWKIEEQPYDENAAVERLTAMNKLMLEATLLLHDTGFDKRLEQRTEQRQAIRNRTATKSEQKIGDAKRENKREKNGTKRRRDHEKDDRNDATRTKKMRQNKQTQSLE